MSNTYQHDIVGLTVAAYSSQYSSYVATNAVDGNTSTYWRCNTPAGAYITLQLPAAKVVTSFRIYTDASYYSTSWTLSGSNDGSTFTDIQSGVCTSTTGWQAFDVTNSTEYLFYKWTCNTGSSSRLYLYEIALCETKTYVKADGRYIGIKFTEEITTNLAASIGYAYETIVGTVTTLNYYSSSYPASNLNDGSTEGYWRGTTAVNWIKVQYSTAKVARGFRWYIPNASYYPITFTISGSNDDSVWTQLGDTFTGTSTTGWQEFTFANTTAYLYYRIDILTASSSRIYISELELQSAYGNERAFTVTGQEYNYVPNGTLETVEYSVASVTVHPIEENALLLVIVANDRFESVVGDLTVAYDATKGTLAGLGGPVESFSVSFTPEDLVAKPHQNDQENIEISAIVATGTLTQVYYTGTKEDENIEIAGITATGILTHVDDI